MTKNTYDLKEIREFRRKLIDINSEYTDAAQKWMSLPLNESAKNYAIYGFMRRLKTLRSCIQRIYEICPPDCEWLDSEDKNNVEIFLHAFVVNTYGAMDNLAHVLNFQLGLGLDRRKIGFFPSQKFSLFIELLSESIQEKIRIYKASGWEDYLLSYRHSLAHRIPLYIPPHYVTNENTERYQALESEKNELIISAKFDEAEKIDEQIKKLVRFEPTMLHDLNEEGKVMFFHAQIIADWNTIYELSSLAIEEISSR